MVDVKRGSIVSDPSKFDKYWGGFGNKNIRSAGSDCYEEFISKMDFSKTKLSSISGSKIVDFGLLRRSLNFNHRVLADIYDLKELGKAITEMLSEVEDPKLFWGMVMNIYPLIWHIDLSITEKFESLPGVERQKASTRLLDALGVPTQRPTNADEEFFHLFDEVEDDDLVTVYRTFSVDEGVRIRKGKAGTEGFFEWGSGLGWSFAPSKFPCIKINPFPGMKPFEKLGAKPNQIKRSIRDGHFCGWGTSTTSADQRIAQRRFLGSFLVQKKDILAYIGSFGEQELLINPANVILVHYRPLSVVDYWLIQGFFTDSDVSFYEPAHETSKIDWNFHAEYENVDALYDVLYHLVSKFAKQKPKTWELGTQSAVKIDDKRYTVDLMEFREGLRNFIKRNVLPVVVATDPNPKSKDCFPRQKFVDLFGNWNLDHFDRPFNPLGDTQLIKHLKGNQIFYDDMFNNKIRTGDFGEGYRRGFFREPAIR